jgi:nicotinamidase-related amidase
MVPKPQQNSAEKRPLSRSPELMNREDTALLVVDVQEKFLAVVPDSKRIVWNIRRLIDAVRILGMPIAAMEQYPEKLGHLAPELKQRLDQVSSKLAFSACQCGEVFEGWRDDGIFRVLVCGIETHVCIMQTALDLAANGFEPYVAVDAMGTRFAIDHETALRRMESAGVVLTTTEAAMFEWCRVAGTPEFKLLSALVKEKSP